MSSSVILEDFPYVPKHEDIQAIDEFVEVDFELLQTTGSPSPKRNGKKARHHKRKHGKRKNHCVFSVVGESGSGKTSLLRYWSDRRRQKSRLNSLRPSGSEHREPGSPGGSTQQKEFIFFYGVNSSMDAQLSNMLGKLEAALKFHFQLRELFVRKSSAHRRWDLVRYLESSAKKSRTPIIIVIDGLSRLKMENGVEADPMLWLPRDLPDKVRFVVSLTEYQVPPVEENEKNGTTRLRSLGNKNAPSKVLQQKTASFVELERRKAPRLYLGVLSLATRRKILSTYAKFHRGSFDLSNDKVMQILACQGSGHPLYLRVLLNSLRTAARLSCIPAVAVGTLLDSVMEGELHGWVLDNQKTNGLDGQNVVSVLDAPEDDGHNHRTNEALTWEERQVMMSKGASSSSSFLGADQEVADLLLATQKSNISQMPTTSTSGSLTSSVEMAISLALQRCEEDVEMELDGSDKGLLGRVLSLLYVSHHGLTENELLGCVALAAQERAASRQSETSQSGDSSAVKRQRHGESENVGRWNENVQNQFEQHRETLRLILDDICMVVRSVDSSVSAVVADTTDPSEVRVIMEHESVRRVVWTQYLGSSYAERDRNHEMLAMYFDKIVPVCPRRIEELPWHYEKLQQYGKVRDVITDVDMFRLWWGDSRMESYRPELIRVWSVLSMPPVGLDLVEEIRTAFEAQIMARHMRDDVASALLLQVAELTIAFQRGGWEGSSGLDCPMQRHPAIPLADLVQNGVPVLQPDLEGEETGEERQFVELLKDARHSMEEGNAAPAVNHETVEFIGEHYYYSRWMWAQFPFILLGFSDMYAARVSFMAAAGKSSLASTDKHKERASPTKRDPIILAIQRLAQRLENPEAQQEPEDKKKKRMAQQSKNVVDQHGTEQPMAEGDTGDAGEPKMSVSTPSKKTKGRRRARAANKMSSTTPKKSSSESPALAPKSRHHPNSPFILDVHAGDRHAARLKTMTESIMKQRRIMNAMLIAARGKEKKLAVIRDELAVLNGLSKGEEISLGSAMKLVSELEAAAVRTEDIDTLSNFYRMVLRMCKAYSANQPEWLAILDDDIERGRRKEVITKELISAVIEQRRDILSLLSEARSTQFHRRGVLSQMLERIEFQHARELENVQNERQWKQRQAMMLRDDIVQENRLKKQREEDQRRAAEMQNKQRQQARNNKLAVWRSRLQRLKDATGVSSIDEMLVLVSSKSQLTTEQNLRSLVDDEETKIATLTQQREQLRNEMMKLRFSANKMTSRSLVETGSLEGGSTIAPNFQKKELHAIAEQEVAVQRSKAHVQQVRRELARVSKVVMDVKVGLEHITRMCGVNYGDAEKAREADSKPATLYFEISRDISEKDRAAATVELLAKVEAELVGKIADLQKLAPRTPNRKRRRRQSKSRDGRRQSKSRDGRVGSPLRCVFLSSASFCFFSIFTYNFFFFFSRAYSE